MFWHLLGLAALTETIVFSKVNLPSRRVQMIAMSPLFSVMYFSPLTLILTLYRAISINLQQKTNIVSAIQQEYSTFTKIFSARSNNFYMLGEH